MISLPVGIKIAKFYDAEMQKVGKGILYLLSNGIMFEKMGEGAKFECNFEYLAGYEAVKKDKLLVVIRTPQGRKSVELKVDNAKQVGDDISKVNQEYANSSADLADSKITNENTNNSNFDVESHTKSEARWIQDNWNNVMKFLKPERVSYLNDYVKNAKTGSPNVDPYLLLATHEDLTYKDFDNLTEFLKWRYGAITEKEIEMIISLFRDFDSFSIGTLDMQVNRALKSKNYVKFGRSLYEHVAINSREIAEDLKSKNIKA